MALRYFDLTKNMEVKEIFRFSGIPDLYCDMDGNFFYMGRPARIVYNNGSKSVLCGKSKRGIISLRKTAYRSTIEIKDLPF